MLHRKHLALLIALLLGVAHVLVTASPGKATATLRFRILDASSGKPTTAMVCLTNLDDSTVRLPPDGRISRRVSQTREFYRGLELDGHDPDWIGPVRKTMGKGNNDDRSYVYGLRPSIPHWREPVMFQTRETFRAELPPGRYRLTVSRGMEYVPVADEFTVEAGQDAERTVRLERWVDLASEGWHSGDVHVHHPTLEKAHRDFLLYYAEAEDLRVVNVLEMGHHGGTDFKQDTFGKASRVRRGDSWLVSGQEEPRSTFGHIIGLNTKALARDLPTYDFYDLAFKRLHAQEGALVGFAHFSWNGCDLPRGFPWLVTTGELDFIELMQFNALNAKDYHDYLDLGFRLTAAAGSDTPWGSTIGEVRTYVHTGKALDLDEWFEMLRRGRTFVTNGPALEFTVDGELPGSELRRESGGSITVKARARGHARVGLPERLELVGNAGVIRKVERGDGDDGPLEIKARLELDRSQWLAVKTHCANGAAAHSTPVYVVVDGQPTWSREKGPAIIERKLDEIARVEREFTGREDARSKGVVERIERARRYYAKLHEAMVARAVRPAPADRIEIAVEVDETVARFTPAQNGAGPLWCYGAPLVVRRGADVFVSALETGAGVPPLSNTRPRVLRKQGDGPWQLVFQPDGFREREPCPIAVMETSLLLSLNTSTQPPGTHYGPTDPHLLELSTAKAAINPVVSRPDWPGDATFTDHSYRGLAVDRARSEVLLLNIDARRSHQVWSHRDSAGTWSRPRTIRFPIRSCYPQVALRDRQAHVLAIGDIVEPNATWRRFKKEKTGRAWDYVFRRLFYARCSDVGTSDFDPPLEIASVESTAGHIQNLDLWLDATGAAHVLYLERPVQSKLMRDEFFPDMRLRTRLQHAVVREGKVIRRQTLLEGGEGLDGPVPGYGRFHATDEALFVLAYVSGSEKGRPVAENRLLRVLPERGGPAITRIPLERPFTTFFTACERGGSTKARRIDVFGHAGDAGALRYARVRIGGE